MKHIGPMFDMHLRRMPWRDSVFFFVFNWVISYWNMMGARIEICSTKLMRATLAKTVVRMRDEWRKRWIGILMGLACVTLVCTRFVLHGQPPTHHCISQWQQTIEHRTSGISRRIRRELRRCAIVYLCNARTLYEFLPFMDLLFDRYYVAMVLYVHCTASNSCMHLKCLRSITSFLSYNTHS